ncbi:MAG: hypothetical protein H0T89_17540 [Deltaproteobacteria bacterium]|nr:hypothetical protein [Deltaproteobacteria bacterium]
MFFSKIWFFLVAVAAAIALTIALVMPRPAQRAMVNEEHQRITVACGVIDILLTDDARNRIDLAGSFARTSEIVGALESASGADKLDDARMKQVRGVGEGVMKTIQGSRKPDFAILIDKRGRVVARVQLDENDYGDVLAGRPLVDDALAGYLRDDLWVQNGTMYFVTASPVVKRDPPVEYVGAIVLGHAVTNELSKKLVGSLGVDVGFYLGGDTVAGSKTLALDMTPMTAAVAKLKGDLSGDCAATHPIQVRAGNEDYTALVARLPGEAAQKKAFYTVYTKRPQELGFAATLKIVRQGDLSMATFPWIIVGAVFLIALAVGIGLMFFEADRPLRRLTADAVRLAKGETERLAEDAHPGKFGSIARSVNIAIDKLGRDAKSAKKDLDGLLGPAPEGSLGTIDLLATALPSSRPGGPAPAVAAPPSEFRFSGSGPTPSGPQHPRPGTPPPRPATPPPFKTVQTQPGHTPAPPSALGGSRHPTPAPLPVPTPAPASVSAPLSLDDDILGGFESEGRGTVDPYFKSVYDQFVSTKQSCGEPTAGLTYEKFAEKLVRNRDDLTSKTGCKDVRFTVYVKDGKAALKATPVKDEA